MPREFDLQRLSRNVYSNLGWSRATLTIGKIATTTKETGAFILYIHFLSRLISPIEYKLF